MTTPLVESLTLAHSPVETQTSLGEYGRQLAAVGYVALTCGCASAKMQGGRENRYRGVRAARSRGTEAGGEKRCLMCGPVSQRRLAGVCSARARAQPRSLSDIKVISLWHRAPQTPPPGAHRDRDGRAVARRDGLAHAREYRGAGRRAHVDGCRLVLHLFHVRQLLCGCEVSRVSARLWCGIQ